MPRPYSADLRERVLLARERREGTREAIARRFRVAASTVHDWLRATRTEGRRGVKPRPRGLAPLGGQGAVLARLVAVGNDATLAEYADQLAARTGVRRSVASVCRALQSLGLVRKKRRFGPPSRTARTSPGRGRRGAPSWPGSSRAGSSSSTRAASTPGWRGPTPVPRAGSGPSAASRGDRQRRCRWERLTVVGALALDGVVAAMSVAAATSTAVFLAFVEQALVPALKERPDAVVVMDNLAAHKAEAVRGALDRAGLAYRHLPPYSPDLNPIEEGWSKLKTRLRAEGARSREALEAALGPALAAITAQDARGWFRLAGYPAPE